HALVHEQRALDFGSGDVVAGRNDHVVGARLVEEITVAIPRVGVAGDVPTALHIVALALVGEITAAGGPFHREAADRARGAGAALLIEHGGPEPGERSEEHTSELQSLRHLVCRLLLEKKNIRLYDVRGDRVDPACRACRTRP